MIVPKIIFEDPQILVIDKPSGIVVNRAESVKEKTIQDWAEKKLGIVPTESRGSSIRRIVRNWELEVASDFVRRSGVVHRLDRDTSGLLLIAKTFKAFENLKSQFKRREVKKKYLALVHEKIEAQDGEINLPIKRLSWDRKKFGIIPDGKKARTRYNLVTCYMLPQHQTRQPADRCGAQHATCYSLLEVEPETGRTHHAG